MKKPARKTFWHDCVIPKPDLKLSHRDPYALRIIFILILACAFFIAPANSLLKIKNGLFLSGKVAASSTKPPFAQIRITPPGYSGLKTILVTNPERKIDILQGSEINAEVQTTWGKPILKLAKSNLPLKQKDQTDLWTIEASIPETHSIRITTYGVTRFKQNVNWLKDNPPIIGWNGETEILPTGEIRLPVKIADDYGIRKLTLRAILVPGEALPVFGAPLFIEKKMNLVIKDATEIKPVFDTTGHVWAGKRVSLLMETEDFAGNISETAPLEMRLPVREFRNPIAARLAALRSNLLNLRGVISDIVAGIEGILYRPNIYRWDPVMTLGLRSIDSRLHYSKKKEDIESSASMMWSLAMRMEDGKISETQTSLREALEKLQEAMQKGAGKAEIAELMQQMQQALIQHLQNLAQKLQQNGQMPNAPPMAKTMNLEGLSQFMQKLQEDLAKGDNNSAMQKLNQLQQLADMLGSSAAQGMPKDVQEMMQNMQAIQDLIARQKKNLDKTRQQNPADAASLSAEQKSINDGAQNLASELPMKIPEVEQALKEMSQAAASLDAGDMASSAAHQQKALDSLNQASKNMQKELQQKMQNMMGLSLGSSGSNGPEDPLGRPQGNLRDDGTEIPGGTTSKKADRIIKTLREREADMKRPLEERNYYQRLLKQW